MSSTYPRAKFLAAGSLALGAAPAGAAIVVFDISPDKTILPLAALGVNQASGIHLGYINLATGTFGRSDSSNLAAFFANSYYSTFTVGTVKPSGGYSLIQVGAGSNSALTGLLAEGDLVSSSAYWTSPAFYGPVEFPSGTFFVGLRLANGLDFNYGWLEMTDDPVAGKLVTRFAFNDVAGGSILAGQTAAVPEASTLGLAGGLFGLVAAAHLRRRRQKQAAASDKFLALAAGEKLG